MGNYDENVDLENQLERDMISRFGKLRTDERANLLCLVADVKFQLKYLSATAKMMKNTKCLEYYSSQTDLTEAYDMVNGFLKDSVVNMMARFCNNAVNLVTKVPGVDDLAWRLSVQMVSEVFPTIIKKGMETQLRMKLALKGFEV